MLWISVKIALTAALIVAVSQIGKTNAFLGALIASIPLVSYLGMLWMRVENVPMEKIAAHAENVFWLVLPSMPFFLIFPFLLRKGWNFAPALLLSTVLMFGLYLAMLGTLRKFGITL